MLSQRPLSDLQFIAPCMMNFCIHLYLNIYIYSRALSVAAVPYANHQGVWFRSCSETGAKKWPEKEFLNPLKDPLPDAPNMRIYCMYGVGAPAERSYHYQHVEDPMVHVDTLITSICGVNTTTYCFSELLC